MELLILFEMDEGDESEAVGRAEAWGCYRGSDESRARAVAKLIFI